MNYYVGIDVSLEASNLCVVDGNGNILCEDKVASEPEALIGTDPVMCPRDRRKGLDVIVIRSQCG